MLSAFYRQFQKPEGFLGSLVGRLMAARNGRRSEWALGLLAPQSGERVLEIGFGPGADVARALARVGEGGVVAGVDLSRTMLAQATARNAAAVAAGRAVLVEGTVAAVPFESASFDAVYSVNCAQFWPDLTAGFREVHRVLKPGGRALVAVQPRSRGATEADSSRWLDRLQRAAEGAGLELARSELGPAIPPIAAVLSRRGV